MGPGFVGADLAFHIPPLMIPVQCALLIKSVSLSNEEYRKPHSPTSRIRTTWDMRCLIGKPVLLLFASVILIRLPRDLFVSLCSSMFSISTHHKTLVATDHVWLLST